MTVDLNVCTGCSACVIACQAENNIPIVGKLQVSAWPRDALDPHRSLLRQREAIQPGPRRLAGESRDRAPADDVPALRKRAVRNRLPGQRHRPQRGWPQRHGLQPLHRHAILREQLPVQGAPLQFLRLQPATGRQKENRRRFSVYKEYFAPLTTKGAPDTIKMQKNPNVTVRMRGVMEKCTYCVQRIEEAKIAAHVRAGASADTRIPRDSFTSACAQACPTEAIVFGDINDPGEPRLEDESSRTAITGCSNI